MKFTAISLFSGALGLDIGIKDAGFDIRVVVDNDKFACETARMNVKIPVIEKDISFISGKELLTSAKLKKGSVDLLFGGPPCQAFSTAGSRKSLDDFRGNVIINFLRLTEEISPETFILENVRGLMSARINFAPNGLTREYGHTIDEPGSVLNFLVKEFEKLGYSISFALFNSANYGVPQKRERVIIFGAKGKKKIPLPRPTHTEDGKLTGKKWVTLKSAFEGLKEKNMHYVDLSIRHKKYLSQLKAGQNWNNLKVEEQKEALGKAYDLTGGRTGFYRRLSWDKPSPTLVTNPMMPATMLCHPTRLRPLSVEEYARIQQFPDGWKFFGATNIIYKQIGNAVPTGLGKAAGSAVSLFLRGKTIGRDVVEDIKYSRYRDTDHENFLRKFEKISSTKKTGNT
jgi:DNA (cytosine-5)-methyltransferase 1